MSGKYGLPPTSPERALEDGHQSGNIRFFGEMVPCKGKGCFPHPGTNSRVKSFKHGCNVSLKVTGRTDPASSTFENPAPNASGAAAGEQDGPPSGKDTLEFAGEHGAIPGGLKRGKVDIPTGQVRRKNPLPDITLKTVRAPGPLLESIRDFLEPFPVPVECQPERLALKLPGSGDDFAETMPQTHISRVKKNHLAWLPTAQAPQRGNS